MKGHRPDNPWWWVPTLYFAEGIPYFVVNVISVTMFKRLGMSNADLAMYTSLLYLPWVIKPLWSPLVDVVRTKRWWVLAMQLLMTAAFALLAFSIPRQTGGQMSAFALSLVVFYVTAMCSATHDIAADGYYMLALDEHRQSVFVGIRSTFYRIASVFGQGVLVVVAGLLEQRLGNIPRAWQLTLLLCALIFLVLSLHHAFFLPQVERSGPVAQRRDAAHAVSSFFRKPGVWVTVLFLLLYRLPEAFSVKMLTPFLLDPVDAGGLGLTTAQSGLVYGTVGVLALTLGGILGGVYAGHAGLKRALWPMSLSLALPCGVYLFLSLVQPASLPVIYACVAFDQFGYGFGFTAYMLYMMYFSDGPYKTSHYAICTAFMALSMMVPGFFAGMLQESAGYTGFFGIVMLCCLLSLGVTALIPSRVRPDYGRK